MARSEENREDLLREATAFVQRAELLIPALSEPVFVGFRQDGAASFFFGQNRVYHFNAAAEVRRAYLGGLLYKAEGGKLCSLTRERTARETSLVRRDLSAAETAEVLADLRQCLDRLADALQAGTSTITGQVPADWPVAQRVGVWIATIGGAISIAEKPGARRA